MAAVDGPAEEGVGVSGWDAQEREILLHTSPGEFEPPPLACYSTQRTLASRTLWIQYVYYAYYSYSS